jgi:phage tail sheath protein FI
MASSNTTPGVYINEMDAFPLSVVGVNSAIPVFVGTTNKNPLDARGNSINAPISINTLAEYIEKFGMAPPQEFTVTVTDNTDNSTPYEMTVTHPDTPTDLYYQMQMFYANGGSTCYVYKTNDTNWTDIEAPLASKDDITIVVLPDTYIKTYREAIVACAELNRIVVLGADYSNINTESTGFRDKVSIEKLKHAAAYTPYLNTSLSYVTEPDKINVSGTSEIVELGLTTTPQQLTKFEDSQTQLYNQVLAAVAKVTVNKLSPIGAMAGVYAKTDRDRGVWMAPANVALNSVIKPSDEITAEQQASLNVDPTSGKSINAIRYFPGKGNLVWGARTLDGNSNDWRYVSVRRTVSYVEQSLQFALQNYVFESNSAMTWLKVSTMIDTFLNDLWQQGGLVGSSANDAYFVNLGLGTTMTAQDILEGRMIINIGLAVAHPAEFIELNVTQLLQK